MCMQQRGTFIPVFRSIWRERRPAGVHPKGHPHHQQVVCQTLIHREEVKLLLMCLWFSICYTLLHVNVYVCVSGFVKCSRWMEQPSLVSWCASVRAQAGWDPDPGVTCSPATATAASRCGTWQLRWTLLTRGRRERERVRKRRVQGVLLDTHSAATRHISIPESCILEGQFLSCQCSEAGLVLNRYRWSHRGGAAAALGPVWSERFPLCDAKYKSRPLSAAQHKTTRVQLKVRTSIESKTLSLAKGGFMVVQLCPTHTPVICWTLTPPCCVSHRSGTLHMSRLMFVDNNF